MASSTVENYLKTIYLELAQSPGQLLSMGRLASAMGVVPGTATTMVKALADSGLVDYEPREGVCLTRGGEKLALHVLRRHRLLELFLVKVLGLDWSQVHEEADELEHAVSDKVLERIDEYLGRPQVDPHGDPIPTAAGEVPHRRLASLADCAVGKPLKIARIMDQSPQFLRFLDERGLTPGVVVKVDARDAVSDAVVVRAKGALAVTLGTMAAGKIHVEEP